MEYADADAVADAIEKWTPGQIRCRAIGTHAWKDAAVSHRPGVYTVRQRCTRNCGRWRERDMDEQGYWLEAQWHGTYPPGYLMKPGSGRVGEDGKAQVRIANLGNLQVVEVRDEAS